MGRGLLLPPFTLKVEKASKRTAEQVGDWLDFLQN